MNLSALVKVCSKIDYKPGWEWSVMALGDGWSFKWRLPGGWSGRKWYISSHATVSEVVQTIFMAALAAEEHEAREAFRYKGKAILGPHIDVEARLATSKRKPAVKR